MTTLIIAEKPNVAKRIAHAFGNEQQKKKGKVSYYIVPDKDVVVASAVGHLYSLRQARPIDKYPFFDIKWVAPYEYDRKMRYLKDYIRVLQDLAEDANEVINACDYDIEGSVIGYNAIVHACKMDPQNTMRMKFSTLTTDELIKSYENREKHLNFPMVMAGLTRHELDWYWGINTSKALSSSVKRVSGKYIVLSAGRVQTPTLYFMNEREREIELFVPTPYWQIDIHFHKNELPIKASYPSKITKKETAENIFKEVQGKNGNVSDIIKKKNKKKTPTPMDLGLLQTEAWANFKFLPKRTQDIAQTLYEAGLISYPRTSSQKLPKSLGFKNILESLQKNPVYSASAKAVLATPLNPVQGKKDDPAHPAIYPTGLMPDKFTKEQEKLYDLIVNRFFSVFMPEAIVENVTVTIDIEGHPFVVKGQLTIEDGWLRFYKKYTRSSISTLPPFDKGENIIVEKHDNSKKTTKPPARYNPASVIKEMENLGIGTKATRANISDTLYKRGYIKGKEIKVTDIGKAMVTTLEKHCNKIVSVKLTNHFEQEIQNILKSKKNKDQILLEAKEQLREIFKKFRDQEQEIGYELYKALKNSENENLGACKVCGRDLKVVVSKTTNKRFIGCSNYPKCNTSFPLPQKGIITFSQNRCQECGSPMIKGRRGDSCVNMGCPSKKTSEEKAKTQIKSNEQKV